MENIKKDTTEQLTEEEKWSFTAETVKMLNLATAHLDVSLHEGSNSVEALTKSFVSIHDHLNRIVNISKTLPDSDQKALIMKEAKNNSENLDSAIINFQFYDKLTQRLVQIANSLKALSDLITNPDERSKADSWSNLQKTIKNNCSIASDKSLFDAILAGKSIEEAIEEASTTVRKPEDDLEFF